jgi:hypothetical protein
MKGIPLRLTPGADLRRALEAWMRQREEQAGCVISAVGSLPVAQLRLAGATQARAIRGELEILSLSGTLSPDPKDCGSGVTPAMLPPKARPWEVQAWCVSTPTSRPSPWSVPCPSTA